MKTQLLQDFLDHELGKDKTQKQEVKATLADADGSLKKKIGYVKEIPGWHMNAPILIDTNTYTAIIGFVAFSATESFFFSFSLKWIIKCYKNH